MDPDDIKTLVHAYFHRLLNERDLSVCDAVLAPGYVDHDAPPGTPPGPEETKRYVRDLLAAYPDLKVQVEDVIASGHRAAAQIVLQGTHQKTGQKLHQRGNVIIHLNAEGYFTERWSVYQSIGS